MARKEDDDNLNRRSYLGARLQTGERATGYDFDLRRLRWTEDLAVTGRMRWDQQGGRIHAEVTLAGIALGTLALDWNDRGRDAICSIRGTIDSQALAAERLAP